MFRTSREGRAVGIVVAAASALAGIVAFLTPPPAILDGYLYDVSVAARARFAPAAEEAPAREPVIVGLDWRSLNDPRLSDKPRIFLAPVWAEFLNAMSEAKAEGVGFDFIFAFSANVFAPNFERSFLQALATAEPTVVLGRSNQGFPARSFVAPLMRGGGTIAFLFLPRDRDGVVRLAPRTANDFDGQTPAFAETLAEIGGASLPDTPVYVAPRRHPERFPAYSLIDVLNCAESAPQTIAETFRHRLVFVGSVIPEEDRTPHAGRLLPRPAPAAAPEAAECLTPVGRFEGDDTAGVFVHALIADALATGDVVRASPAAVSAVVAFLAAVLAGWAGARAPAAAAGTAVFALLAAIVIVAILGLMAGFRVSVAHAALATPIAGVSAFGMRFALLRRQRERVQSAFGRYLAPSLVRKFVEGEEELKLGGEVRPVSVMFADLSGFTAWSTRIPPEPLVDAVNGYLAVVVEAVDRHGGYIDKFIGDAVMALWGAPISDPEAGMRSLLAALESVETIETMRIADQAASRPHFNIKVGIAVGDAIVGNVGTDKRLNYTAMGETVNMASRFEGLATLYGCKIVIAESLADLARPTIALREIDRVVVKGGTRPQLVFQPLGRHETLNDDTKALAAAYADALALYRRGAFAEAAAAWRALADRDPPSAVMAQRAEHFLESPPEDWDGVYWRRGK